MLIYRLIGIIKPEIYGCMSTAYVHLRLWPTLFIFSWRNSAVHGAAQKCTFNKRRGRAIPRKFLKHQTRRSKSRSLFAVWDELKKAVFFLIQNLYKARVWINDQNRIMAEENNSLTLCCVMCWTLFHTLCCVMCWHCTIHCTIHCTDTSLFKQQGCRGIWAPSLGIEDKRRKMRREIIRK